MYKLPFGTKVHVCSHFDLVIQVDLNLKELLSFIFFQEKKCDIFFSFLFD